MPKPILIYNSELESIVENPNKQFSHLVKVDESYIVEGKDSGEVLLKKLNSFIASIN